MSPSTRHHVRFWRALDKGDEGEPVWLGAATFDRSVGVSHYTGQITHHIAPDIDAERDLLERRPRRAGHVAATYQVSGVGPTLLARNGGGDRYFTDGEIRISRLRPDCASEAGARAIAEPARGAREDDGLRMVRAGAAGFVLGGGRPENSRELLRKSGNHATSRFRCLKTHARTPPADEAGRNERKGAK